MKLMTLILLLLGAGISQAYLVHQVDQSKCNGCGMCAGVCSYGAATMDGNLAIIDPDKCMLSSGCAGACYYHCHNIPAGGDAIYKTEFTGIEGEESGVGPSVAPSPCRNLLTVTGTAGGSNISVHNLAGREVWTQSTEAETTILNTSTLSAGTYLLMIDGEYLTILSVIN